MAFDEKGYPSFGTKSRKTGGSGREEQNIHQQVAWQTDPL
jgi:hypothetical protein